MAEPRSGADFAALNREIGPYFALREQASQLRVAIVTCWDHLATEHPDWKANDDERLACFGSLWNITRYAELSLHYLGFHLGSVEAWSHFTGPTPSPREIIHEITVYSQSLKTALFHLYFSAVESSHRSFLRALDPRSATGAPGYEKVYRNLMGRLLNAPQDDRDLLDLLRLIRNTIHNQGAHQSPAGDNTRTYKGIRYHFTVGAPLNFVTWRFVLDRATDLVLLQERAIRHPLLVSHADPIRNASAGRLFSSPD